MNRFVFGAATAALALALPAIAQAQQLPPAVVGVVDTDRIMRECTACVAANTQLQAQLTQLQQRAQALRTPIQTEGQAIVAQAQQVAQRLQEEGRAQASTQAEALLERARSEIQLERDAAIAELRKEFADLTIAAAEKVIGQSLDRTAHQRLIDEALAQSSFREN